MRVLDEDLTEVTRPVLRASFDAYSAPQAVRPKACPSCQPAYGPLIMPDPRPGRPPAKPAPPTFARAGRDLEAEMINT